MPKDFQEGVCSPGLLCLCITAPNLILNLQLTAWLAVLLLHFVSREDGALSSALSKHHFNKATVHT